MRQEINRKILHVLIGTVLAYLIYAGVDTKILMMILFLGVVVSLIYMKIKIPIVSHLLDMFDRDERIPGKGAITYMAGVIMTVLLFENKEIAAAAVMVLAWGDSASALVGKGVGRIKNPINLKKTIEGSLAGVITGTVGAMLYADATTALVGGISGAIAEIPSIRIMGYRIDDNIIIPLFSATLMHIYAMM